MLLLYKWPGRGIMNNFFNIYHFAYVPPSTINSDRLRTFDKNIFYLNLRYRQDNYIYEVKKPSSSWIYNKMCHFKKEYLFVKISLHKLFQKKCSLAPKTKIIKFFCQYHVKAEGRSILRHPDIINASMNLREKLLSELRQCSFTAP